MIFYVKHLSLIFFIFILKSKLPIFMIINTIVQTSLYLHNCEMYTVIQFCIGYL